MILCITPNPALDRNLVVPNFKQGEVCRSHSLVLSAGGKGVNVARAVRNLGGEACCVGLLGGYNGRHHAELVEQEGMLGYWTWIEQETRAAVIVNDPSFGQMTVINENGPHVSLQEWENFKKQVLDVTEQANAVCLSGSLPPGIPPDETGNLIKAIHRKRCRMWVDSSGKSLKSAIEEKPTVIKINRDELVALMDVPPVTEVNLIVQLARQVLKKGVGQVVVTLGKDGAVLVNELEAWLAAPPEQPIVSPIGSGDSFLAGLVISTINGLPIPETLRLAVAAGTANAMITGAGKFSMVDFDNIASQVTLQKIF
jgi:1-phosphofructokinase family hexose kinase